MRNCRALWFALAPGLALALVASPAAAQSDGYAVNPYQPAERGSDWFANESLDLRGAFRPAIGAVGAYSSNHILFTDPTGAQGSLGVDEFYVHVGASLTFLDRFRLAMNLPLAVHFDGSDLTQSGVVGTAGARPAESGAGDLRLGGDVRLLGEFGDAATLAIGAQVHLPTGSEPQYTANGKAALTPRILIAGDISYFVYAAQVGYRIRFEDDAFAGTQLGDSITGAVAVGLRVANRKLVIGPELFGSTLAKQAFKQTSTPLQALFGAHYQIDDVKIGLGAGGGLADAYVAPTHRVPILLLAGLEWAPAIRAERKDRDHDGVYDEDDACPDQPGPRSSNAAINGCPEVIPPKPSDRDGDGVLDADDACPDVPGVKTGDPKTNGCPADRDGDGVADKDDACPDVPGAKTDDPKTNGCPGDRDGDGVADKDDACPDVAGVKTDDPKTNGCPADRDGDGVADKDDACPDQPGIKSDDPKRNGCPARAAIAAGMIKITEQVQFKTGSATILPASDALLTDILGILKDHPEITKVHIEGHTDNKGTAAGNKTLSDKRARAVMAWLALKGIDKGRMDAKGFGQERPLDTNATDEGRQNNRRVEFHIEGNATAPAPAP